MSEQVTIFAPYTFEVGEKIRIEGGRRAGDWLVVEVDDKTVTLQCPISKKTYSWTRFCYLVDKRETSWPERE